MATQKHNLRVITTEETEAPKTVKEELADIQTDFLTTISLLEVLRRAVDDQDNADLWTSLGIAIGRLHDAHDRLDVATMRIAREGASRTIRKASP